jgi:uncharacterized protein YgbK (DUF1537 family)
MSGGSGSGSELWAVITSAGKEALLIGGVAAVMNVAGIDNMVGSALQGIVGNFLPYSFTKAVVIGGTVAASVLAYELVMHYTSSTSKTTTTKTS